MKSISWFEACGDFEVALPPGSYTLSWRIQSQSAGANRDIVYGDYKYWDHKYIVELVHFTFSKNFLDRSECMCYIGQSLEAALKPTGRYKLPTISILGKHWQDYGGHHCHHCRAYYDNHWQDYDVAEFSINREEPSCMLNVSLKARGPGLDSGGISMDCIVIRRTDIIKNLQRGPSLAGPSIDRAHRSLEGARFQFPDVLQKLFSTLRKLS